MWQSWQARVAAVVERDGAVNHAALSSMTSLMVYPIEQHPDRETTAEVNHPRKNYDIGSTVMWKISDVVTVTGTLNSPGPTMWSNTKPSSLILTSESAAA